MALTLSIDARFRLQFDTFVLDCAFNAPARGITALFGASGSGKTTLLRCIAGLIRAEQGELYIGGVCWQNAQGEFVPTHRRSIGYVFQEANLFPHLSVRGNLEFGLRRTPTTQRRIDFEQAVVLLELEPLLSRRPETLSGGERQRVAIARALLTSPSLLLLDEPLSALDDASKADILPYFERLHHELSIPAIYVSHAVEEVARLADYMVLIEEGTIRAHGPLATLLTRADLPLARADNASSIVDATVASHDDAFHLSRLEFDGGQLLVSKTNAPRAALVRVRIQARDVSIALTPPQKTSMLNILPARVLDLTDDARGKTLVRLGMGNTVLLAHITRKSATLLGLAPGVSVHAQIKSVALPS